MFMVPIVAADGMAAYKRDLDSLLATGPEGDVSAFLESYPLRFFSATLDQLMGDLEGMAAFNRVVDYEKYFALRSFDDVQDLLGTFVEIDGLCKEEGTLMVASCGLDTKMQFPIEYRELCRKASYNVRNSSETRQKVESALGESWSLAHLVNTRKLESMQEEFCRFSNQPSTNGE